MHLGSPLVILLSLFFSVELYFLSLFFQNLVLDKKIHFEQVYKEYNLKFVNPRIFVRKRDQGTLTR